MSKHKLKKRTLNSSGWQQAAQAAGYSQDVITQAGLYGYPINDAIGNSAIVGTPSDPNPSGTQLNYTGCVTTGSGSDATFICWKNGTVATSQQVNTMTFNPVVGEVQTLGAQCVPGSGSIVNQPLNYCKQGSFRCSGNASWKCTDGTSYTLWNTCAVDSNNTDECNDTSSGKNAGQCTTLADGSTPPPDLSNSNSSNSSSSDGSTSTTLDLTVGLNEGTGSTSQNSTGATTTNTSNSKTRNFAVQLLDQANNVLSTQNATLPLNTTTGKYQGSVSLTTPLQTSGYHVQVTSPGYFANPPTATSIIQPGTTNAIAPVTLSAGNITGTSVVMPTILDYNVFLSCSIFSTDGGAACKDANGNSLKASADLNGDGVVNQDDYTILLKSWQLLQGNSSTGSQ